MTLEEKRAALGAALDDLASGASFRLDVAHALVHVAASILHLAAEVAEVVCAVESIRATIDNLQTDGGFLVQGSIERT